MCPNRRPLRPQQPIFGTFLRGDLHFGRHTTSSADLTATRLGELHDMRVQHAGDTLCDDLVSCKPPTTGGVEGAGRTYTRPERQQARKNSPSTAPLAAIPRKNSPNKHKTPNLGCFQRAGRMFRAFAITQCRRANFSRPNETDTTFACSFASTHETGNTFAHPQCRKIKHFVRAKVTAVSPHRKDRAAKVSTVSARQSVAPNRQVVQYP